jgi:hypothetical protein
MLRACPRSLHQALLKLQLESGLLAKVWLSSSRKCSTTDEAASSAAADALLDRLHEHKRDRRWRDALSEVLANSLA